MWKHILNLSVWVKASKHIRKEARFTKASIRLISNSKVLPIDTPAPPSWTKGKTFEKTFPLVF